MGGPSREKLMDDGPTKLTIDPFVTSWAWWVGEIKAEGLFEPTERDGKDESRAAPATWVGISSLNYWRAYR
jgi:hypothetical protein